MWQSAIYHRDIRQNGIIVHVPSHGAVHLRTGVIRLVDNARTSQQGIQHKGRAVALDNFLGVAYKSRTVLEQAD